MKALALRSSTLRWCLWALSGVLAALISLTPWSRGIDDRLHDAITVRLPDVPVPPGVVLIDISERSLELFGPWPWPRPLLAKVAQALQERGARVQVWDLLLPQEAPGDDILATSLARAGVVVGQVLITDPAVRDAPHDGKLMPSAQMPPDLCSTHSPVTGFIAVSPGLRPVAVGHVGATPDADGRLRSLPAVVCHQSAVYPQLVLAAAEAAEPGVPWRRKRGFWPWEPSSTLVRGGWQFPLDNRGWLQIPYARAHTSWPAISVEQLLDPKLEFPELRGSVVLLGATALGLGDVVSTPYHPAAPGLSIHAEIVAAAIPPAMPAAAAGTLALAPTASAASHHRWPVRGRAATALAFLLTLIPGLLLVMQLHPHRASRATIGLTLVALAAPLLVAGAFRSIGWVLPLWPVMLALLVQAGSLWVFNAMMLRRESRQLAQHLQSFMPPALARRICQDSPTGESLGELREGTLMALRIAGIERWVGAVEPLQGLALIHAVHATAQALATRSGGRLEHAQGHTLLLAWPGADGNFVRQALDVAQQCGQDMMPLLGRNESETHPLSLHIAIESGAYLQGIVGTADNRRAVLIGPAATDALAMLELSDELATPVLVGPRAAAALEQAASVRRLGQFVLPEQSQPKPLYCFLPGLIPALPEAA